MIKCKIKTNTTCLKCNALEKEMVLVGAFILCKKCWKEEFDKEEIDTKSKLYNKYLKWYKKYENFR